MEHNSFWSLYSKPMDTKDGVKDFSSCLLLEATGDSELDSSSSAAAAAHDEVDDGNDDAESCSCDSSYTSYRCHSSCVSYNLDDGSSRVQETSVRDNNEHQQDQEQEDEVRSYQNWVDGHIGLQVNQKSCVSEESTNEPINEMERNRLFWEACLAS